MVNYNSPANVESPQHFILLHIIMIGTGQVPPVITQPDQRNPAWVQVNDTLQSISALEPINLFLLRAPTGLLFYLDPRFFHYQLVYHMLL